MKRLVAASKRNMHNGPFS